MAKNKNDYFKLLEEHVGYSVAAADLLESIVLNFDNINLDEEREKMHLIEHKADELHHEISSKLSSEFITVLEQEDILHLAQLIDDITDVLDEIVMEFYMYHVVKLPSDFQKLAKVVNRGVKALQAVISDLRNFKKSEELSKLLVDVSSIESEADDLYIEAIHNLFASNVEYKTLIGCKSIYESLENCCDLCERTGEVIEQIIIKNT